MNKSFTFQEACLFYGFPGLAIIALSLFAAIKVSGDFGGDMMVKFVTFIGSNVLLWLLYVTLFQRLPSDVCAAFTAYKRNRRGVASVPIDVATPLQSMAMLPMAHPTAQEEQQEQQAKDACKAQSTDPQAVADTSSERYQEVCAAHDSQREAEKAALTEAIVDYTMATMPPYVAEKELENLCEELRRWCDDPCYIPREVSLKKRLSTIDLGHFVWNIAERLNGERQYGCLRRAQFCKALFAKPLHEVQLNSIANFTKTTQSDRIPLDRPRPDDNSFHYRPAKDTTEQQHTAA